MHESRPPTGTRFSSRDAFHDAVRALKLPLTDEELNALWTMVTDLHDQADSLLRFLKEMPGATPLRGCAAWGAHS
ncbi:MAG: hypothetical protein QN131_13540 [Armatimonadota bacterium]|nr:hypothetical protein [Armatimonadota bacterium]